MAPSLKTAQVNLKVMAIHAVHGEAEGYAMAVGTHAVLGVHLPAIRGMRACLFPPSRAWVIALSISS
jgi:hypothetical protein